MGGCFLDRGPWECVLGQGSRAKALRWSLSGLLRWSWTPRSPGVMNEVTV